MNKDLEWPDMYKVHADKPRWYDCVARLNPNTKHPLYWCDMLLIFDMLGRKRS